MHLKKKLCKNTFYNYFYKTWILIVALCLFPFIIHHLGLAAAGVWLLVNSFVGYVATLSLGIGPSLTKYVAQFQAENNLAFTFYIGFALLPVFLLCRQREASLRALSLGIITTFRAFSTSTSKVNHV